MQLREIVVIKSDESREAFDRAKIEQSVALACRKRGIAQERLDQLVSGIQRQIETLGESEVPANAIGEMVMDGLQAARQVAYIRFASVYRDFGEAKDFEEFASAVQDMSGREAGRKLRVFLRLPAALQRQFISMSGTPTISNSPWRSIAMGRATQYHRKAAARSRWHGPRLSPTGMPPSPPNAG